MNFGIAGSHRSGKTTLARAVSLELGIEYLDANVSSVITGLGFTPKQELPFKERLMVQNAILDSMAFKYAMMGDKPFITDRTPLDVLGYTFAEIRRETLDDDLRMAFQQHVMKAVDICVTHLWGVLIVAPLYGAPESETSAQACPIYMQHVYASVREMASMMAPLLAGSTLVGQTDALSHEERVSQFKELIEVAQKLNNALAQTEELPRAPVWTPNS